MSRITEDDLATRFDALEEEFRAVICMRSIHRLWFSVAEKIPRDGFDCFLAFAWFVNTPWDTLQDPFTSEAEKSLWDWVPIDDGLDRYVDASFGGLIGAYREIRMYRSGKQDEDETISGLRKVLYGVRQSVSLQRAEGMMQWIASDLVAAEREGETVRAWIDEWRETVPGPDHLWTEMEQPDVPDFFDFECLEETPLSRDFALICDAKDLHDSSEHLTAASRGVVEKSLSAIDYYVREINGRWADELELEKSADPETIELPYAWRSTPTVQGYFALFDIHQVISGHERNLQERALVQGFLNAILLARLEGIELSLYLTDLPLSEE